MIKRALSSSIIESLASFPVIGIIGPRQSGKTTLVKEMISKNIKNYIYLDLEKPSDLNKLSEPELYLRKHQDKCVILDEIQRMAELFPTLRSLIDEHRKAARFIILGSASPKLLKNSSESLAGRIIYKELSPFNYLEIKEGVSMTEHWFRGGFPESILAENPNKSKEWIDSFIATYIERDLPMMGLNVSVSMLRKFWIMVAHFNGNIWNANSFAKALGISSPTISRYCDFLEESFLITRLPPFYMNIKKRLIKSPKIYFRDSGLLHRMLDINSFEDLQGNVIIGHSWEGYVIEQIKQLVKNKHSLFYYRTQDGSESDLVLVKGDKPIHSIEIKYSSNPKSTRGFSTTINDLKTINNFIIIPNEVEYPIRNDITVCGLSIFLEKYLNNF